MKLMKPLLSLVIALLVSVGAGVGCSSFTEPLARSATSTESSAVAAVRRVIDEGYATLTSLNRVIASNAREGVWTKSQAQSYLNQTREVGGKLDKARDALALGDIADAKNQAELTRVLLVELQRRVAAEARK